MFSHRSDTHGLYKANDQRGGELQILPPTGMAFSKFLAMLDGNGVATYFRWWVPGQWGCFAYAGIHLLASLN
eukprot:11882725-Karenia_brevis.AAC.1